MVFINNILNMKIKYIWFFKCDTEKIDYILIWYKLDDFSIFVTKKKILIKENKHNLMIKNKTYKNCSN